MPAYLADCVLEYAHDLDSCKVKSDRFVLTPSDVRSLLQVIDNLREVLGFPRNSFTKVRKQFLRDQINHLQELIFDGQDVEAVDGSVR